VKLRKCKGCKSVLFCGVSGLLGWAGCGPGRSHLSDQVMTPPTSTCTDLQPTKTTLNTGSVPARRVAHAQSRMQGGARGRRWPGRFGGGL